MLLYSGHEEENAPHKQRVKLMTPKTTRSALMRWKSHAPRIIKSSLKRKKQGITINSILCFAPTTYTQQSRP
ncbi:unnamed protein product [Schistosoma curassoni]|uniref:Ovule protein n=1 Tax=Schistosoma curassoni TaxID=6186 RepID=A0A183KLK6_9TREM|nr:unnamed protein product [Schistosoma curassoni]